MNDKINEQKINVLDRRIEHLLLSNQLEESGTSKFIIISILVACLTIVFLFIWAANSEIQEITSASGTILPASNIQPIQHLEGGIVSKVYKNNGDTVKKNDIIITLNPEPAASELSRLKSRFNTLQIDILRLESFLSQKKLSYRQIISNLRYKSIENNKSMNTLIKHSLTLLQQKRLSYNQEKSILETQVSKLDNDLSNYENQLANLKNRIDILSQQHGIYQQLDKSQTVSKLSLLDSLDRLKEVQGQFLELSRAQADTQNLLTENRGRLSSLEYTTKTTALEELTDLSAEHIEIQKLIQKATDRVDRLTVKSPVLGILKGLSAKPGTVISPGNAVFDIVPIEGTLIVEAKILTKDIGHIQLSDKTNVKVSAFDFATYGQLSGEIQKISASTFQETQDEEPYYKAIIKLEKGYFGSNPQINRILPGMTVSTEILTDKKSILAYMFKPIRRSLTKSFRER